MTRAQQEKQLEDKYLGKVITIAVPGTGVTGKVNSIALWEGEVIVIFSNYDKYEIELDYFTDEYVEIHGNNASRPGGSDVFGVV